MRLLVLGGTHFVGRALVETALARGDEVTVLSRGATGRPPGGVEHLVADRTAPEQLSRALGGRSWDAAVDTWSGPPRAVADAVRLLADRVGHYGYVSSVSVYRWPLPPGADESTPVVDADPDSTASDDYAAAKRGAELAVLRRFSGRALLARAGLILGPYEDVGRLPWWLGRVARGGRVAAPGPPDRPLQLVDARDLAAWLLRSADAGFAGVVNATSPAGLTTTAELLDLCREVTGSSAELVWRTPEQVESAGVAPWTELPIWTPPTGELAALHEVDVAAALAAGLSCRPVRETVADTWAWWRSLDEPLPPHPRAAVGLTPERERALLGLD